MAIPESWNDALTMPLIAAPMFLASSPKLVVAACRNGVVGTFPALNQRTTEGYDEWLTEIEMALFEKRSWRDTRPPAPYGVNLIVHSSNQRLDADLEVTVSHRVPLVITSLGAASRLVDAVHSYGGLVFHDVANLRHARKAVDAGVDGIIAVCAGAGGHGGMLSPFALVPEIRAMFDGTIILSGAITRGADIVAARALGADLGYMGTRFLATSESDVPIEHKQMIVDAEAADIMYTDKFSVSHANYLRQSIVASGWDPERIPDLEAHEVGSGVRPWKNVWSAGQGVGSIDTVLSVDELCAQLLSEYRSVLTTVADLLPAR
ncbi:MAG: Nitropropane dioxygenase/trans-enoyl-CoA reductase family protein [Microbacteriaceae bacterium]|nr:Nitropropane dioxygenase/trans-enoyl-CoA reductase family protein [Microbacteriaceae bacterium]